MLGDKLVGRLQTSPVNGEGVLDVDVRNAPGNYTLQFLVSSLNTINASLTLKVQGCGPGEVAVAGQKECCCVTPERQTVKFCDKFTLDAGPASSGCTRLSQLVYCNSIAARVCHRVAVQQ